jgi:DNA-binding cell septation regulator SpoVG
VAPELVQGHPGLFAIVPETAAKDERVDLVHPIYVNNQNTYRLCRLKLVRLG